MAEETKPSAPAAKPTEAAATHQCSTCKCDMGDGPDQMGGVYHDGKHVCAVCFVKAVDRERFPMAAAVHCNTGRCLRIRVDFTGMGTCPVCGDGAVRKLA